MQRLIITVMAILLLMSINSFAKPVGKILELSGDIDITSMITGKRIIPEEGTVIDGNDKIRTGRKSFVSIVLNDGSKLFIREISVLYVQDIKLKLTDQPTRIQIITGKLRVIAAKTMKGNSLVVYTPTAIAGVRGTDFGIIATQLETRVVIFQGNVEVANKDKNILKSYILKDREETKVTYQQPPEAPVVVPDYILSKWFDTYSIDEKKNIIIKRKQEDGLLDRLLRKKDF
ncbi:MAG TPA: FecR family protein [Spirochaetota bacterium]|nr:FecR domain-containing protein [Spirochaetota bacterium]HOM86406.1 FecR family protein [Spirochaetota bacterium]HOT18409.1 FecR family protein [Spirochaetota bacterium]HPD05209.1 FecR family protein [Spirochaetota bacterium]HPK44709.1 FecR family protein [Spirochaetota bacterium]